MVQILPPKTSLGNTLGQALGSGLSSGIQKGNEVGFQRGMLQNALQGLESLPKEATPFQLASQLMQATAGIPGAERYVGALYPILLQQLQNQKAFPGPGAPGAGGGGAGAGAVGQLGQQTEGQPLPGATAQEGKGGLPQPSSGTSGGILGSIVPQDEIHRQAQAYAQGTMTGLGGYTQKQTQLLNQNAVAEQQRKAAEQKAADIGIPKDEVPLFMQLGQRYKFSKTLDDWVRATDRDFKEVKKLTKTLDSASYPGFVRGLVAGSGSRENQLKRLDYAAKKLVDFGFEQNVRTKLAESGLSPTEVEERIHPFTPEQRSQIQKLPQASTRIESPQRQEKNYENLVSFLRENIKPDTSLLALRQRLWQDKGYDWEQIAQAIQQAKTGEGAAPLSTAQENELTQLTREPPRQSLSYIFQDWGNFIKSMRGEK